jgi:hypothetical protein
MSYTPRAHSSSGSRSSPGGLLAEVRPASPGQLALIGVGLWLVSLVVHGLAILAPIGVIVLVVAGVGYLIRPRSRTMYWRGRQIDLGGEPTLAGRLYHAVFKH